MEAITAAESSKQDLSGVVLRLNNMITINSSELTQKFVQVDNTFVWFAAWIAMIGALIYASWPLKIKKIRLGWSNTLLLIVVAGWGLVGLVAVWPIVPRFISTKTVVSVTVTGVEHSVETRGGVTKAGRYYKHYPMTAITCAEFPDVVIKVYGDFKWTDGRKAYLNLYSRSGEVFDVTGK